MAKKFLIKKIYEVNCYTKYGHNYATHTECSWEDVKTFRRIAKLLGEKVEVECVEVRKIYY